MLSQHLSLLMSKNTSTNSPCLKSGDVLLSRYRFQGLAITEWITLNVGSYFMDNPKQQFHQPNSSQFKTILSWWQCVQMERMNVIELNWIEGVHVLQGINEFFKGKRKSPQKLRKEMKTGKDFSFVQISSMREETVEFFHQSIMFVIVMFISRPSASAFSPESPILL